MDIERELGNITLIVIWDHIQTKMFNFGTKTQDLSTKACFQNSIQLNTTLTRQNNTKRERKKKRRGWKLMKKMMMFRLSKSRTQNSLRYMTKKKEIKISEKLRILVATFTILKFHAD